MKSRYKVTFQPSGRTVHVLAETILFEAAARAGVLLQSPCGGKGTCGKCRVRVVEGACAPSEACRSALTEEQLEEGYRLACQAKVGGDSVVDVPDASLYEASTKILTSGEGRELSGQPAVWKRYVELPCPSSEDAVADLRRLEREIGKVHVHLDVMQGLPNALRDNAFKGTAVVCSSRLLAFEPGNTEGQCYGVAFDLGTTTVVGELIDLTTGRELAVVATMNPQISLGDDVISRITRARETPGAVEEMQASVVGALNELIEELVAEADVPQEKIYEITVAGNTTMQHLFCGISPAALGEVPFPPAYNRTLMMTTREVGLRVHPNARLCVFPNIGGFVGGDTVAGILANGLHCTDRPAVLVDIGTNGEIVLACDGKLFTTSTAAGPAFEGARISAGMRATVGAIEKVVMNGEDLVYNVIGDTAPIGLCGTGLIDLAAVLLRAGIIDATGRVLGKEEVPSSVPSALCSRLHERDDGQVDVLVASAEESKSGEAIYLLQRDIRELQLATGAIRAGLNIMLQRCGLTADDLSEVLIAGGFGNFIRRGNARRIGLLPNIPSDRLRFVGNASSMGAKYVLISEEARGIVESIAESAEHVDLSMDPEFQMEFGMAMMFPEDA
ncbi:MAG: DUF4445 domain-containing protein [Lentisphaerae bacterium]|nr:DUF4445 domain-containing protein [Lentisphaerota bacterium]MBT4821700.1 DUF4445 domain-containing protein [Lentisphaerota bacterium]MBT5606141.1 DUF4445 domain-containing protein [Lentisphaerota bacterium]MBT7056360.1 DUF4445 domain-containing protein [Lentisphaerota bacterium]MBT7842964.1 DUF4445 domain-containing protein [Lentisphaerota bacterium]